MTAFWKKAATFVLALAATVNGQYFGPGEINVAWETGIAIVRQGNGAFMSPRGDLLVVVSQDGAVRGIDPSTGTQRWIRSPTDLLNSQSFGGVFFSSFNGQDYILYSVVAASTTSQVFALNPADGSILYASPILDGVVAGTPVTTENGQYIITTHNVDGSVGYFTIFEYGADAPFYTFSENRTESLPFSPVGYYWAPIEGNFAGGELNRNDVFIWAYDTPAFSEPGNGAMFAFQLPRVATDPPAATVLNDNVVFQTPNAPVLANEGMNLYMSVTKAEHKAWLGDGRDRNHFGVQSTDQNLARGTPPYVSAEAPPTLTSDDANPVIYGPTAAPGMFRMNSDFTEVLTYSTSVQLTNKVLISPDELYVYIATVDGFLFQLNGTNLDLVWQVDVQSSVEGEIAVSADGAYIYVPDLNGNLRAYQVAVSSGVTPGDTPGVTPTSSPTMGSTTMGTTMGTDGETTLDTSTLDPSTLDSTLEATTVDASGFDASTLDSSATDGPTLDASTMDGSSELPTLDDTADPTASPGPTVTTTMEPTTSPVEGATMEPTASPNVDDETSEPTESPVSAPTRSPTRTPVRVTSNAPSASPTDANGTSNAVLFSTSAVFGLVSMAFVFLL